MWTNLNQKQLLTYKTEYTSLTDPQDWQALLTTYTMKNYSDLRKISKVFHQYGIDLTGKRKYASFETDLKMDRVFVSGLIFELEYELRKQIADDKVEAVQAPAQIIKLLMG
jgi:acyl carrier protein